MLQIDYFSNTNPLRNVHPVQKACFSLAYLLFALLTKSIGIAVFTFIVMSLAILAKAKIPWTYYVKLLLLPFLFLTTSVLTLLLSLAPVDMVLQESLWEMKMGTWQIYVSSTNLERGIQLTCTVVACISSMYFFILTTPFRDIQWLLQKLRLSPLFIELVSFTYRFIFVLIEKAQEIYVAQSSRLGYESYRTSVSSLAHLVVSLFVKSMQAARDLQMAMDSRGGEEDLDPIEITSLYHRQGWVAIGSSMILLIGLTTILVW